MRRPLLWLYTALLVTIRFSCVRSLWGAFEYTVEECEYNLNEAACSLCAGTRVGLDWRPLPPTCIGHPDGCCKHDGFEYFMKSSLANYLPGHITSYFFPRDDMIFWMGPEPSAGIAPPGRCVWSGDYLVEIARCRIMPAPPPSPTACSICISATDSRIEHVLGVGGCRIVLAAHAILEQGEAILHEEDDSCRQQNPGVLIRLNLSAHFMRERL